MSDIICKEREVATLEEKEKEEEGENEEKKEIGEEEMRESLSVPEVDHGYRMWVMTIETPTACSMDAFISETETVRYTMNFTY